MFLPEHGCNDEHLENKQRIGETFSQRRRPLHSCALYTNKSDSSCRDILAAVELEVEV